MTWDEYGYVRLQVDLVLEIAEAEGLIRAARVRIASDELMPEEQRAIADQAVSRSPAEAVAYLVDPVDLVTGLPGVELTQASWSSEPAVYDPEAADWVDEDWADESWDDAAPDGAAPDDFTPDDFAPDDAGPEAGPGGERSGGGAR
ncbi:hypothetical protein PJ985_05510 [Streptomyces sp. ACA25]|uniref:hypothetical protein n=1 Tax=Streptomyces sp. ACA25 TaxID=3022596 RepID=UPI002307B685|nr:hypothetical protein [Streptomyces sp. ACA25]MDB1087022.1 hypothetical protein [Streptomyces sp. ACA25]